MPNFNLSQDEQALTLEQDLGDFAELVFTTIRLFVTSMAKAGVGDARFREQIARANDELVKLLALL